MNIPKTAQARVDKFNAMLKEFVGGKISAPEAVKLMSVFDDVDKLVGIEKGAITDAQKYPTTGLPAWKTMTSRHEPIASRIKLSIRRLKYSIQASISNEARESFSRGFVISLVAAIPLAVWPAILVGMGVALVRQMYFAARYYSLMPGPIGP